MRVEIPPSRTTWREDGYVRIVEVGAHSIDTDWWVFTKGSDSMAKRKTKTTEKPKRGRPRNQDLPGMQDRAIKPLEDLAASYADVRDRRMELNKEEHELKAHTLKLMKKYEKTIYRHDGIEIRIVPGEEDVKVKVKKPGDEDADEKQPVDEAVEELVETSEA